MLKNFLYNLRNILEAWKTCNYHGLRVKVNFEPRTGTCEACERKFKLTNRHHWLYAFTFKEIRENPELVIKYTNEFCFLCHRAANSLRMIFEDDPDVKIDSKSKIIQRIIELREIEIKKAIKDGRFNKPDQKRHKYKENKEK